MFRMYNLRLCRFILLIIGICAMADRNMYPNPISIKDILLGRQIPDRPRSNMAVIPPEWTAGRTMYLEKRTLGAFLSMAKAAKKDGIDLVILSAFRSFASQKGIWEAKWAGRRLSNGENLGRIADPRLRAKKILEYSSMPGTSRHHWGTDIDLNSLDNAYFIHGPGRKVYHWLIAHAPRFGFCQPYTTKGPRRPYGYSEERWHWSYRPVSSRKLADYLKYVRYTDIHGFAGAEQARSLHIIDEYVNGVDPACKVREGQ